MLIASALFCHAPIVIPEVAGRRAKVVSQTSDAMLRAAEWLISSKPDRILILSPHAPRFGDNFSVSSASEITGSFSDYDHPEIQLRFPVARNLGAVLCATPLELPLRILPTANPHLDHGSLVPLYFLGRAGWTGSVVVVGFPQSPTREQCLALGGWIAEVARGAGGRTALCVSGDMSHALSQDAPNGFHPLGEKFDHFLVEKLSRGDLRGAVSVPHEWREGASEEVMDSLEIAAAALDFSTKQHHLFSYEGPLGVGYLVAGLFREGVDAIAS